MSKIFEALQRSEEERSGISFTEPPSLAMELLQRAEQDSQRIAPARIVPAAIAPAAHYTHADLIFRPLLAILRCATRGGPDAVRSPEKSRSVLASGRLRRGRRAGGHLTRNRPRSVVSAGRGVLRHRGRNR